MFIELKYFWGRLNANYWFWPALFSITGAILALAMIWLDRNGFAEWLNDVRWIVPARPSGAANMLGVMASSMIGVASTVFSITIAAVAYASGNYGPRLLTNFMEDRGNQLSLATFIGSFVYALVVLRSVRTEEETASSLADAATTAMPGFTPQLSLLVAYLLMALCVGVLVFFLNHIPSSIRINKVLEGIGVRLLEAIRETYPVEDTLRDAVRPKDGRDLVSQHTGYIQLIDFAELQDLAQEHEAMFSLTARTGDFVHRDLPLMKVSGVDPDAIADAVRRCYTLGPTRTPEQDPQFLMDELVEIGLRALSPGINDPFTAITALHWLGAATAEIGRRDLRKDLSGDEAEDSRVTPCPDDFAHFAQRGFGSIRSAAATSPNAAVVMLESIENAARPIQHPRRIQVLREEAEKLVVQARLALSGPDLETLEGRFTEFTGAMLSMDVRAGSPAA
ncbi:DUF2254 domain-containing protein [Erythrobacter arachoides]|uniref:DUF2254 domain-containing protein n=1 Tax=Aurantiacibacter arachoides TaxID=1850444 RepID=A0A844ZWQ4_9SPHN|nr:DUF2254 domain-containing protein [Aurantiacibacter arachoides]MXO92315.1 DUF2254 domain-containing protein [Aurantiacibacter arachoides]GGD58127.1 hypothetical protein GCM10011411_17760 [Aurantiacibacter arachoides]